MGYKHIGPGDIVHGNKETVNINLENGEKILYDKEKVIREFFLRLDREPQVKEFHQEFLNKSGNHPFFFFVHGSRSDMHQHLMYRIEQFTISQIVKRSDIIKTELIDAHFFHNVKTMEEVIYYLNQTLENYFSNKLRNHENKFQEAKKANELLKQSCFTNTLLLLNHNIYLSRWNSAIHALLVKYIEFWNCCQDIKVAIFLNIVNDNVQKLQQAESEESWKLIEEGIRKIKNKFKSSCFLLTKLTPINHIDIDVFVTSLNNAYKTKSFSIESDEKLAIEEVITMEQAIEKYSESVAQFLYERDSYSLENI